MVVPWQIPSSESSAVKETGLISPKISPETVKFLVSGDISRTAHREISFMAFKKKLQWHF